MPYLFHSDLCFYMPFNWEMGGGGRWGKRVVAQSLVPVNNTNCGVLVCLSCAGQWYW